MTKSKKAAPKPVYKFGIAEWYGRSFVRLSSNERRRYADLQFDDNPEPQHCPFLSTANRVINCWKKGGVCSLRSYEKLQDNVAPDRRGSTIRTTCPSRLEEGRTIYRAIGDVILGDTEALAVGQINFLEKVPLEGAETSDLTPEEEVGRIDNVLVTPRSRPLQWCPVEIQAVYFSGDKMANDFAAIRDSRGNDVPFPVGRRRPDYRSSGPKRLMPQLQIKVPTLSRWGKKMAVVVDEDFFKAMGRMEPVPDLSNCDVVWFVVRYEEAEALIRLVPGRHVFTTLDSSVRGLIAGRPVTRETFEAKIQQKLAALRP